VTRSKPRTVATSEILKFQRCFPKKTKVPRKQMQMQKELLEAIMGNNKVHRPVTLSFEACRGHMTSISHDATTLQKKLDVFS
jgi:hypothetical protein